MVNVLVGISILVAVSAGVLVGWVAYRLAKKPPEPQHEYFIDQNKWGEK